MPALPPLRAIAARVLYATTAMACMVPAGAAVPADPATEPTPVRPEIYAPVRLTADLAALSARERQMLGLFIEAAEIMDGLFWQQSWGDPAPLLAGLADERTRRFAEYNYGPWDRLEGNRPFVPGVGAKPLGARLYPEDMTRAEFEAANLPGKADLYTLLRRDPAGKLAAVPYHVQWREPLGRAAALLEQAAELADDAGLRRYLQLRATALRSDDFGASDRAWLEMKNNGIDLVIGPIETYEDRLFGYKAAYSAYVLVKDREWSARLARYAAMLPELQRGLPVAERYKQESPGTDSDLNAYDVVYYAGDSNSGSKTIAINLPNDEQVQLEKGTRRLQLKNAMRAKFDAIMRPIAAELIVPEQLRNVTFDAFFANVMFHEVAHGLGIKNTLTGRGTVREALKDLAGGLEEGKADILGLYMVTRLHDKGELPGALEDHYVTFVAGIFRSVRFGAASAHGRANMVAFNYLAERGAFARDAQGRYRVDVPKMRAAVDALSAEILGAQGDGDYARVERLNAGYGAIGEQLREDLERLTGRAIPVDVAFIQGKQTLGLQ